MMSCGLRFLRRLTSPEISHPCRHLPSAFIYNFSSVSKPTVRQHRNLSLKFVFPFDFKKSEVGFCTRAIETEQPDSFWLYSSVCIRCSEDVADMLSEALLCFGASSVSMDDIGDSNESSETWITSLFADGEEVHTCISRAADSIGLQSIPYYEVSKGEHVDWLKNLQGSFHPLEIITGLWVVPKWIIPPVQNATNIILNPGMAFGTGEHATTKLCLILLHELIKGGEHVLDYGTGSGVLGIAALKMGAELSVGIDVDPQAVASAHQNLALNGFEADRMRVYLVSGFGHVVPNELYNAKENFDIVIANILLNPLLDLADDIVSYAKPGAVIGLSGIISEQIHQLKVRYSMCLDNISVSEIDGWACIRGTRRT
ncbi:hypothetical protein HPP92_016970 [Vanilla planifolia]|uniref:ETFB lysine methyltransferase n=1 Tax=Vanilla planifolia TaxID=51239 RepID=A0A835QMG7_VANPL|nr:hypothetical protein HPP92_016970 [Vanilla planifolia]